MEWPDFCAPQEAHSSLKLHTRGVFVCEYEESTNFHWILKIAHNFKAIKDEFIKKCYPQQTQRTISHTAISETKGQSWNSITRCRTWILQCNFRTHNLFLALALGSSWKDSASVLRKCCFQCVSRTVWAVSESNVWDGWISKSCVSWGNMDAGW